MAGTGAEIVLLMHDGLVWEVPQEWAVEAYLRIEHLMLDSLRAVCAPCRPVVKVEIRRTWGEVEPKGSAVG